MRPSVLIALALAVFAGGWGYARYDLTERLVGFERDLARLHGTRGGHLPDEGAVYDQVEQLAAKHGLTPGEIEVDFEDLDASNIGRAGGGAQMVAGQAEHMAAKLAAEQPGSDTLAAGLVAGAYDGTLIDVTAQVSGKKWLWSVSRTVEGTTLVRHGKRFDGE